MFSKEAVITVSCRCCFLSPLHLSICHLSRQQRLECTLKIDLMVSAIKGFGQTTLYVSSCSLPRVVHTPLPYTTVYRPRASQKRTCQNEDGRSIGFVFTSCQSLTTECTVYTVHSDLNQFIPISFRILITREILAYQVSSYNY